jgi:hypothetical protein
MRNTIAGLCALLLLSACGEKESTKNLQITGNVEGLKKGTLYIRKMQDTTLVLVDSITINGDSKFESDVDIASPEMFYLFLDRGVTTNIDNSLMFFAEPGKINIETNLEQFFAKAKITGSKNHDLYEEYKKVKSRYTDQQLELSVAKFNAMKDGKPFSEEENNKKIEDLLKRKYLYAINFAVNHRDYEVAPYIALSEISNASTRFLDTIHNVLTPKVAKSKYGSMLSKFLEERKKQEQETQKASN